MIWQACPVHHGGSNVRLDACEVKIAVEQPGIANYILLRHRPSAVWDWSLAREEVVWIEWPGCEIV
jgi:hypothetical protein